MDRIAPTRPPEGLKPAGFQTWKHLLFAHWSVPADVMRAVVPAELDLDLWDGRAWVGVVPFVMQDIRPAWVPEPLAMDFLETNLRTYVSYKGEPGVFFFSLEASSLIAVKAARWGWGLPYFHAEMSASFDGEEKAATSRRAGDPSAVLDTRFIVEEALAPSDPTSFEFFLLERYYLFNLRRGAVWKGHVHHVPYLAHRATVRSMSCGLIGAAGLPPVTTLPEVAHYSPGVDVAVYGPWRL